MPIALLLCQRLLIRFNSIWIWNSVDKWTNSLFLSHEHKKKNIYCHQFCCWSTSHSSLSVILWLLNHTNTHVVPFLLCVISLCCSKRLYFILSGVYSRENDTTEQSVWVNNCANNLSFILRYKLLKYTVLANGRISLTHYTFNTNWYWSELIWL